MAEHVVRSVVPGFDRRVARRAPRLLTAGVAVAVALVGVSQAGAADPLACPAPTVDDRCEAWVSTYERAGGTDSDTDTVADVAMSPAGDRLFLAGTAHQSTNDMLTLAVDPATGAVLWAAERDGEEGGEDVARAVAVSPDATRVFVAGTLDQVVQPAGWSNADFGTVAYDAATGEELWVATYDGSDVNGRFGFNQLHDVAVSPDGRLVYVAGMSVGAATVRDILVVAYDVDSGAERWRARFDEDNGDQHVVSLTVTPDGARVVVTGVSERVRGSGVSDLVVVAWNADGTPASRWVARERGAHAVGTAATEDSVYVAGQASSGAALVMAYDAATGQERWRDVQPRGSGEYVAPTGLAVSRAGDAVAVIGRHTQPQLVLAPRSFDYHTAVYDSATGAQRWTARYGFPGATEEEPVAAVFSPDGTELYVTGSSSELYYTATPDYLTLAYGSAQGEQRWIARYSPSYPATAHRQPVRGAVIDHHTPVDAAVAPDGSRLFVSGQFLYRPDLAERKVGTYDIGTVAYDLR